MPTDNTTEEKKATLTIEVVPDEFAQLGSVKLPIMMYRHPARERKDKTTGQKKLYPEKTEFRAGTASPRDVVMFAEAAISQAGQNAAALAEKIFGPWLAGSAAAGFVNKRDGTTGWDPSEYVKDLVSITRKRTGSTTAELEEEQVGLLNALLELYEVSERYAQREAEGNPFTAADWAEVSEKFDRPINDIDTVTEIRANAMQRRAEVQNLIAEKARQAAERQKAKEAKAAATPAPAPAPAPAQ